MDTYPNGCPILPERPQPSDDALLAAVIRRHFLPPVLFGGQRCRLINICADSEPRTGPQSDDL